MNVEASVVDLEIRLDEAEVRRWLGYRKGRPPRPRVAKRISELWPEVLDLLSPRGAWRVVEGSQTSASGLPRPTPRVGVAVSTIGSALEDEARRRGEDGALLDSLILDAAGSAAAEAAADALNQKLCVAARGGGHHPGPRLSPGYGCWDVAGQAALLALLPTARLDLRLTPASMLVPHKSVSFAVRFESKPAREETRRWRCKRCGLVDCPYRIDGQNNHA